MANHNLLFALLEKWVRPNSTNMNGCTKVTVNLFPFFYNPVASVQTTIFSFNKREINWPQRLRCLGEFLPLHRGLINFVHDKMENRRCAFIYFFPLFCMQSNFRVLWTAATDLFKMHAAPCRYRWIFLSWTSELIWLLQIQAMILWERTKRKRFYFLYYKVNVPVVGTLRRKYHFWI